jgi:hypothetical protein
MVSSKTTGMSPEEMRARADLCKRMALSFGPTNSEMMREVADLRHRLAADADARAANPLRPLGVSLNGRRPRGHSGSDECGPQNSIGVGNLAASP